MLFSMHIVFYLFLGGCVAGLLLITAINSLVVQWEPQQNPMAHLDVMRCSSVSYSLCLIIACASVCFLLFDLKMPDRAYLLFLHPTATPISIGAFILIITFCILGALFLIHHFMPVDAPQTKQARTLTEALAIPCALGLMSYTGVFLSLVKSVPLWHTPLTVVLFVLSALSAGYALSGLVRHFCGLTSTPFRQFSNLHIEHALIMGAELTTLVAFILYTLSRPEVAIARSVAFIEQSALLSWLMGGVVILGILAPLLVEIVFAFLQRQETKLGSHHTHRFCLPADISCLLGCFLLRYCLVAAGIH